MTNVNSTESAAAKTFRAEANERTRAGVASPVDQQLIAEFRTTRGEPRGVFAGAPVLLLTTTGARSGAARTTPLLFTRDGERIVLAASKAGAPTNPAWYYNLLARPVATVELGGETFAASARTAAAVERDRLFARHAVALPMYAEYQGLTNRRIPIVVLDRIVEHEPQSRPAGAKRAHGG